MLAMRFELVVPNVGATHDEDQLVALTMRTDPGAQMAVGWSALCAQPDAEYPLGPARVPTAGTRVYEP